MMTKADDRQPLTHAAFEVLLALADTERHGYAILQDIRTRTAGQLSLHPGSLYRTLNRLVAEGLVEKSEERPAPELDDERRRYYRLTPDGRERAAAEVDRLVAQVAVARARRLLTSSGDS